MKRYIDRKYRFTELFDANTGFYVRSGIIDDAGKDTGVDPFMRSYPALIDIGIMQRCVCANKCKVDCYQRAIDRTGNNMSLEDYESILKQSEGKVFQCLYENEVALRKTPDGYVSCVYIKDVNIGDYVYCGGNKFAFVYEKNEKFSDVYSIDIGYGKKIFATKEHRFMTTAGLKRVDEILIGDELVNVQKNSSIEPIEHLDILRLIIDLGFDEDFYLSDCPGMEEVCRENNLYRNINKTIKINMIKNHIGSLDYSNAKIIRERSQYSINTIYPITSDLMKLIGHYVGNGGRRSYTINSEQKDMIDVIKTALNNCFPEFSYAIFEKENTVKIELNSAILHEILFDKVLQCRCKNGEKQFPNFIYSVSKDMQLAFLSGYFCDGNLKINESDGKYGSITFNTSSDKLHKDIGMLLSIMGVDYSVNSEGAKQEIFSKQDCRIINKKKRYRVVVSNLKEIYKIKSVIRDHRNNDKFEEVVFSEHDDKYLRDRKGYIVKEISLLPDKKKVVDINIDSEDHLFVTSHGIVTHNCALGGAGDPDTHENFEEILALTRQYEIVPNFTTSGITFTRKKAELCKKYCGAVAVSEHNADYTRDALNLLMDAGVKTNIHYVLSAKTIDDAIYRLKNNGFHPGINAVVFLLYKAVGLGKRENLLKPDDPRLNEFFSLIDAGDHPFRIGFDSCTAPGIINNTSNINLDSIDYCEGGRFSMYIDANMNAMPCSFGNQDSKWHVSLRDHTIEEAWNSDVFEKFRSSLKNSCSGCSKRAMCAGGCPICREIVLCNKPEKDLL